MRIRRKAQEKCKARGCERFAVAIVEVGDRRGSVTHLCTNHLRQLAQAHPGQTWRLV